MKLETPRLEMNCTCWSDLESIHELLSFPEVDEFNTLGTPESIEETKLIIAPLLNRENKDLILFSVSLRNSYTFIGMIGIELSLDKFKIGKIFYFFKPQYWGNGYATECVRLLIKFGFSQLNLHRIEAGVVKDNIRSINVLKKSNMVCEGLRRKIIPIKGEWVDSFLFSIIEDEYTPQLSAL